MRTLTRDAKYVHDYEAPCCILFCVQITLCVPGYIRGSCLISGLAAVSHKCCNEPTLSEHDANFRTFALTRNDHHAPIRDSQNFSRDPCVPDKEQTMYTKIMNVVAGFRQLYHKILLLFIATIRHYASAFRASAISLNANNANCEIIVGQ